MATLRARIGRRAISQPGGDKDPCGIANGARQHDAPIMPLTCSGDRTAPMYTTDQAAAAGRNHPQHGGNLSPREFAVVQSQCVHACSGTTAGLAKGREYITVRTRPVDDGRAKHVCRRNERPVVNASWHAADLGSM
jgi:hypothetical protein